MVKIDQVQQFTFNVLERFGKDHKCLDHLTPSYIRTVASNITIFIFTLTNQTVEGLEYIVLIY